MSQASSVFTTSIAWWSLSLCGGSSPLPAAPPPVPLSPLPPELELAPPPAPHPWQFLFLLPPPWPFSAFPPRSFVSSTVSLLQSRSQCPSATRYNRDTIKGTRRDLLLLNGLFVFENDRTKIRRLSGFLGVMHAATSRLFRKVGEAPGAPVAQVDCDACQPVFPSSGSQPHRHAPQPNAIFRLLKAGGRVFQTLSEVLSTKAVVKTLRGAQPLGLGSRELNFYGTQFRARRAAPIRWGLSAAGDKGCGNPFRPALTGHVTSGRGPLVTSPRPRPGPRPDDRILVARRPCRRRPRAF